MTRQIGGNKMSFSLANTYHQQKKLAQVADNDAQLQLSILKASDRQKNTGSESTQLTQYSSQRILSRQEEMDAAQIS